jgi:hypothetical protein
VIDFNYPTDLADVLEAAADVLAVEGWIQGKLHDQNGYCAIGALNKAAGYEEACFNYQIGLNEGERNHIIWTICKTTDAAQEALIKHLNLNAGGDEDCIPFWNDAPGCTAEIVIDAMKHTAKDLRNRKEAA